MTEYYIDNEAYNAAVNAMAEKTRLDQDQVKTILGENGNVWPMSIMPN